MCDPRHRLHQGRRVRYLWVAGGSCSPRRIGCGGLDDEPAVPTSPRYGCSGVTAQARERSVIVPSRSYVVGPRTGRPRAAPSGRAGWCGRTPYLALAYVNDGRVGAAIAILKPLLSDFEQILSKDHPYSLRTTHKPRRRLPPRGSAQQRSRNLRAAAGSARAHPRGRSSGHARDPRALGGRPPRSRALTPREIRSPRCPVAAACQRPPMYRMDTICHAVASATGCP
jgi:hypothetical protein